MYNFQTHVHVVVGGKVKVKVCVCGGGGGRERERERKGKCRSACYRELWNIIIHAVYTMHVNITSVDGQDL